MSRFTARASKSAWASRQFLGDSGEFQPLLDDGWTDEEPRCYVILAQPLLAQGLKSAKLVERM
jgi:hypothetical protein